MGKKRMGPSSIQGQSNMRQLGSQGGTANQALAAENARLREALDEERAARQANGFACAECRQALHALEAENARLREALRQIADFRLGFNDPPSVICAIARDALAALEAP